MSAGKLRNEREYRTALEIYERALADSTVTHKSYMDNDQKDTASFLLIYRDRALEKLRIAEENLRKANRGDAWPAEELLIIKNNMRAMLEKVGGYEEINITAFLEPISKIPDAAICSQDIREMVVEACDTKLISILNRNTGLTSELRATGHTNAVKALTALRRSISDSKPFSNLIPALDTFIAKIKGTFKKNSAIDEVPAFGIFYNEVKEIYDALQKISPRNRKDIENTSHSDARKLTLSPETKFHNPEHAAAVVTPMVPPRITIPPTEVLPAPATNGTPPAAAPTLATPPVRPTRSTLFDQMVSGTDPIGEIPMETLSPQAKQSPRVPASLLTAVGTFSSTSRDATPDLKRTPLLGAESESIRRFNAADDEWEEIDHSDVPSASDIPKDGWESKAVKERTKASRSGDASKNSSDEDSRYDPTNNL